MASRKSLSPAFPGDHTYKWGHMQRLRVYKAPMMALDHHGTPYVADEAGGPWTWDLRCACGHEWTILEADFPGKRVMRSCGRAECPFSHPLPPRRKRVCKSVRCVNLEHPVIESVDKYAGERHLSFSAAVNVLLRTGLGMTE